jgi:hypothetical protein
VTPRSPLSHSCRPLLGTLGVSSGVGPASALPPDANSGVHPRNREVANHAIVHRLRRYMNFTYATSVPTRITARQGNATDPNNTPRSSSLSRIASDFVAAFAFFELQQTRFRRGSAFDTAKQLLVVGCRQATNDNFVDPVFDFGNRQQPLIANVKPNHRVLEALISAWRLALARRHPQGPSRGGDPSESTKPPNGNHRIIPKPNRPCTLCEKFG